MVESTAKLRQEVLALSGVDIMKNADEFKSTYDVMDELSAKWKNLTDIQQASIIELMAGKHQGNVFASLMSNFDVAREALEVSADSAGSAMQEHAKWSESLEAKLNKLKAAWQSLSQSFMNSSFLKGGLDALVALVDIIDELVGSLGTLGTIGLGAGIFSIFKNRGVWSNVLTSFSAFGSAAKGIVTAGQDAGWTFKRLGSAAKSAGDDITKSLGGSLSATIGGIGLAVAAASLLYGAYKDMKEAAAEARQEVIESSDAFLDSASSFEQAYIKYSGRTDLTADEEAELTSAINGASEALDDKSNALQKAINTSSDYVSSLEDIAKAELKVANEKAEEKLDKAKEGLKEAADGWETFDGGEVDVSFGMSANEDAEKIAKEVGEKYYDTLQTVRGTAVKGFKLETDASADEIVDYYYMLLEYQEKLKDADLGDTTEYENTTNAIEKLTEAVETYTSGAYDAAKASYQMANGIPKTTEEFLKMREAILNSSEIDGLSFDAKNTIASMLDDEYKEVFDLSSIEAQARKFVGLINGFGDGTNDGTNEIGTVETFLNMRTAVNGNECTIGQYLSELDNVTSMAENFSDEEKAEFVSTFGLDTDKIKAQYDEINKYIGRNYFDNLDTVGMSMQEAEDVKNAKIKEFQDLINGLTASELAAVVNIKSEIDWDNTSTDKILEQIQKEAEFLEAMSYTISVDVEAEGIASLNTALSESVSATGLSSTSISALKSRYAELESQGYDLSSMFEETSNGIHLNRNAVDELEKAYASGKLTETEENLNVLKDRYDELTKEIDNCTDAGERANLYNEQQEVAQKINDLATLASQYEGLTSAYNAWQNAESAGNERDMYENIITGFKTVKEELSRGWADDGTIKFLELMTGKTDLVGKSAKELKQIYKDLDKEIKNTGYSVKDFFTVDDDGNSTSKGVYNFLKAVETLEKDKKFKDKDGISKLVQRDKDGNIISFDFQVAGGDEAIAEALGISEELVQIMKRAADDAGFVVTIDGKWTQLADLKTSAEKAGDALKKLKTEGLESLKDVDLDFDFSVDTVKGYQEQLEKATNVLDKFRDKNGKLKTDSKGNLVEGAKQALEVAEYYTVAMDKLTEPQFMQIDTSEVEENLKDPIEKMKTIVDLCKEKHLISLTGDTKDLEKKQGEIDKIAKEIEGLKPEVKAQIGIDEDWDAKTIAEKIEKGEIEVPAELKVDVQMSEDLKDMRLMMMRELGLATDNEIKLKIGYEIDDSLVDKLDDDEKQVVIEYIEDNKEVWDKLGEDEKEAIVKIVADGTDVESWEAEEKEALVKYVVDEGEIDGWTPEQKQAWAKYLVNHGDIDEWIPEIKQAYAQYMVDSGDVEEWTPDDKEAFAKYIVDGGDPEKYQPPKKKQDVKSELDSSEPDNYKAPSKDQQITAQLDSSEPDNYKPKDKSFTVKAILKKVGDWVFNTNDGHPRKMVNGTANVNGTAFINGTTGRAFKHGSWSTKDSGTALVGELGTETLVRNGHYYTIGDTGAEFIHYEKGDIIFNHKQTEELFANGKVTSGGGRGKALVGGTAFAKGTVSGLTSKESVTIKADTVNITTKTTTTTKSKSSKNSSSKTSTKSSSKKSSSDDFKETFDWIEIALKRAEEAVDKLDKKASQTWSSWGERNNNVKAGITAVNEEIKLQEKALKEYTKEANSIDLASKWKKKVENGTIDISTITNEEVAEKIKKYQEYYEKAKECEDKLLELQEERMNKYMELFDNVLSKYDAILERYDHKEAMINEYIAQAEANGEVVSSKYYEALIENEKEKQAELEKERSELLKKREDYYNEQRKLGKTDKQIKNSEAWMNMSNDIDDVTLSIEQCNTALAQYNQEIRNLEEELRDLEWEAFDRAQDKISNVIEENDFQIELNSKRGNDSNSKGLHAQNYHIYTQQANLYAQEIARLNKEIAECEEVNQELIDRRDELIDKQRDCILAAEDERQAIGDLIREGLEKELDALQERIDKYEEALDKQKDLYDYQKRVKEQTKEIASLEKQMAAYRGDDSEEAKAKIQEIKVSLEEAKDALEETEYERYISEQKRMLDELYDSYESIINDKLDNIDGSINSVIGSIDSNTSSIISAITEAYEKEKEELAQKVEQSDKVADDKLNSDNTNSSVNDKVPEKQPEKEPAKEPPKKKEPKKEEPKKEEKTIKKGGKIKAGKDTKIYASKGAKSGSSQYYKNDPIYKVLEIDGNWLKTRYHKLDSGVTGWFKKGDVKAYKFGARRINSDDMAWTQEDNKKEFIVRPSDGAILTPVAKGDSVLNANASSNIWKMANSPTDFIKDNLSLGNTNVPNNSNTQSSYTQNLDKVVFNLPNVKNYDELLSEMQKDKNFEKLIHSMSIDRLAGRSALAKNKVIR